ncbi:MAG: DUF2312 domain-containing protein [Aquisalinus sp.]|nr:DUF2312 domain-containing protein [Aquisalinus sp.]
MADGATSIDQLAGASSVAADRLRSFIERVERLEEDKAAIMNDIKEVFAEAKGEGYDVKTLRQVIRLRKMDRADRQEMEALLELYLSALGDA